MNLKISQRWDFGRNLFLTVGVISALATSMAVLNAQSLRAQSKSPSVKPLSSFHNVFITWSGDVPVSPLMWDSCVAVHYTGVSFAEIISRVYQVPTNLIAGANKSSREVLLKRYDITATADRCRPLDQHREMIKALLNERFNLVVKNEAKKQKVYVLSIGENGSQLRNARPGSPAIIEENGDVIVFHNQSMPMLCAFLRSIMSHPVLDQTGLTGAYDFSLRVQYHGVEGSPGPGPYFGDKSFESIRTSAEKLGLRFQIGTSQAPNIFVVDADTPKQPKQH